MLRCLKARETLTKKLLEIIEQRRKKLRDPCRMFRICTMLDALLCLASVTLGPIGSRLRGKRGKTPMRSSLTFASLRLRLARLRFA